MTPDDLQRRVDDYARVQFRKLGPRGLMVVKKEANRRIDEILGPVRKLDGSGWRKEVAFWGIAILAALALAAFALWAGR